ncbi:DUF3600 domain-containing protein [Paenibacillus sp. sptzw28]|uniref:DUF3600 domain-containing protein n=1 Tax=Paenibacillus sp. sptzw28 TaxID=715179 RepID=UPI001C6F26D5|nr:DUF3600 domain-containing protein [Paenibacillus sp. sptzw28]QYR22405.1 DUF3600 domain-containing protein [Paenibacillus sp. sptzw28]
MSIEEQIRYDLRRFVQKLVVPVDTDYRITQTIGQRINPKQRHKKLLTALLVTGVLVLAAAVPATLHADRIYGSFESIKKKATYVTKTEYMNLSAKFAGWDDQLGDEYPKLEKLMKRVIAIVIENGDNGILDPNTLNSKLRKEYKQILMDMQPYFDKLNKEPISRNYLNEQEYDSFIEANLSFQSVLAKLGVKNGSTIDETKLSNDMAKQLREAREQMRYARSLVITRSTNETG